MGDAKPKVRKIMTEDEIARLQAERVKRSRVAGWTIFLAKMFAGREPGKWELYNALLGLDYRIETSATSNQERFDAASEAAGQVQVQILTVYTREDVIHGYLAALRAKLHDALTEIVEWQDGVELKLDGYLSRLVRWHDSVREAHAEHDRALDRWRSLGWFRRRRTPRPCLSLPESPLPPALPSSLTIMLPEVPPLPELGTTQQRAEMAEDCASGGR